MQAVKDFSPVLALNSPGAHGRHDDMLDAAGLSPYVPARHGRHSADELAPLLTLYVPAGHVVQLLRPADVA